MSVAELRSAQAPQQDVPSADELIARAKKLAPKLRERAVKAERDREIPQEFGRRVLSTRASFTYCNPSVGAVTNTTTK